MNSGYNIQVSIRLSRYSYGVTFCPLVFLFVSASEPVFGALKTDGFWVGPFHFYRVTWRMAVGETAVP